MKGLKNIFNTKAKGLLSLIVAFVLIGFVDSRQSALPCKGFTIFLEGLEENQFLDENEVKSLLEDHGEDELTGKDLSMIDLRKLEQRALAHPYINKCDIYKDLEGMLIVNALLRKPMARIVRSNGPDAYIAFDGVILPISDKFTSRVVLVSGNFSDKLLSDDFSSSAYGVQFLEFLSYIYLDNFWKAQIAQLDIDKNGEITLYPQVTKQIIEFGEPDHFEEKLRKLKVFYKEALPLKGWNNYVRINLKYENQIIAE
ncbi:MAG: cell division protein FtsQ [Cyclobacteriaceae bacterium]|nr:cell division protein FtsQ [Cyclobacteriaceae bacterium]